MKGNVNGARQGHLAYRLTSQPLRGCGHVKLLDGPHDGLEKAPSRKCVTRPTCGLSN